jgi:hypothetical protein
MVAQASTLIAMPPGPHLVSCFAGTLPQFIASGRDPKAATDKFSWHLLKANGIATNWNVYLGAKRSGCTAAIDGRAAGSTVGEVVYTFTTAAEPVDAFDSNMFHTATAPPAPRPGMTIGPRTGFGTYSESAAEANGAYSLVWAQGNALVAVVAPNPAEVRRISQAIRARM